MEIYYCPIHTTINYFVDSIIKMYTFLRNQQIIKKNIYFTKEFEKKTIIIKKYYFYQNKIKTLKHKTPNLLFINTKCSYFK